MSDEELRQAAECISDAGSISVFTGAGISVPSGIPDFRSPGGLWSRYDPLTYVNYDVFKEVSPLVLPKLLAFSADQPDGAGMGSQRPELFWRLGRELVLSVHEDLGGNREEAVRAGSFKRAQPNAAHKALVELEELGKRVTVVTQNIDGLHQAAGSKRVVELHGTDQTCTCMTCKSNYAQDEVLRQWLALPLAQRELGVEEDGFVPKCPNCTGGVLKPDVTFFGEALPAGALARGSVAVLGSPVCLVVGTSLQVAPANLVPTLVKARWGAMVVCNADTAGREKADVFLQGKAEEVLPRLVREVRALAAKGRVPPRSCVVC